MFGDVYEVQELLERVYERKGGTKMNILENKLPQEDLNSGIKISPTL